MKSEIQIQAEAYQFLFNNYPQIRGLLFHVPNGGQRNAIEGMQLKASGVVAGIPDLILIWKGFAHGIEVKKPGGFISPVQRSIHAKWMSENIPVIVCYSANEIIDYVVSLLNIK